MNRRRFAAWLLALLFTSAGNCQSKLADNPKIEKLIDQLASDNYKERVDAQRQLAKMPEAIPYLKQALGSTDPEKRERIRAILAGIKKQIDLPKTLERANAFANSGKIELALEQLLAIEPPIHKEIYWKTALDISNIVKEKALEFYRTDFNQRIPQFKSRLPDFLQERQFGSPLQWISTDMPWVEKGPPLWGCVRSGGGKVSIHGILLSSKVINCYDLGGSSIVLTHDISNIGHHIGGSLVVATDSHFAVPGVLRVEDSIIICRKDFPRVMGVKNSILISSRSIPTHKKATQYEGQWIIQENEPKPLKFIEWFETSQIGIEVDSINGSIEISKLDSKKTFAQADCKVGDKLLAVNDAKIDSIEDFRIAMRRGVIDEKVVLLLARGKKTIEVPIAIKE